jgi:hypothetical protein
MTTNTSTPAGSPNPAGDGVTRNASLADLRDLLLAQHARTHDLVAPATAIRAQDGLLVVHGADAELTVDGVTCLDGIYRPTKTFDQQLADKLGIPARYLHDLRQHRLDLYDAKVNGWLHGRTRISREHGRQIIAAPDTRRFMIRTLTADTNTDAGTGGPYPGWWTRGQAAGAV